MSLVSKEEKKTENPFVRRNIFVNAGRENVENNVLNINPARLFPLFINLKLPRDPADILVLHAILVERFMNALEQRRGGGGQLNPYGFKRMTVPFCT